MAKRLGLLAKLGIVTIIFMLLTQAATSLTLVFTVLLSLAAGVVTVWTIDILIAIGTYHKKWIGEGGPVAVVRRAIERRVPESGTVVEYSIVFVAATLLISSVAGTGVLAIDDSTPSYDIGGPLPDLAPAPSNSSHVGGSFGKIQLNGRTDKITLEVDSTDRIDGVIIVGPDKNQIASSDVGVGTRKVEMRSSRSLTNGTYEVIGVRYDVNSDNILLSQVEQVGSHKVQLNVTST